MKSWPKVKLGKIQVGLNIAPSQSYLAIICPYSHEKLTKSLLGQIQVGSNIVQNHSSSP